MTIRRPLPVFFIIIAVVVLLGYGLFEARRLIAGPQISVAAPRDGSAVAGPLVHIAGSAENTAFLSINGKQAFVDQKGHFDEALSPPPGYTVFTISASDRFGHVRTKVIEITIINYCPAYV